MLYHGSVIKNLSVIQANSPSHATNGLVAYFTEDRGYALVCCRTRKENFVTMGLRDDGKQHYFERFPHQLEALYRNKEGYLYLLQDRFDMVNTKGHTWECSHDVLVRQCEYIPDVYEEILKEESRRHVVIHRYDKIDQKEQKMHANWVKEHINDENVKEIKEFLWTHFSPLWDEEDSHESKEKDMREDVLPESKGL
ncbi:MAG: hypothetical protein IJ189_10035 [Clostridia bacterium]|nr:hypothetical protein [Clostridia bacterium]